MECAVDYAVCAVGAAVGGYRADGYCAVAQGKTAPGGRSKTIQPLETGVVEEIAVGNGQHVKAGQVLVKLAAVGSDSDYTQAEQALQAARLSRLRQQALLSALDKHEPPQLPAEGGEGLPPQALAAAQPISGLAGGGRAVAGGMARPSGTVA